MQCARMSAVELAHRVQYCSLEQQIFHLFLFFANTFLLPQKTVQFQALFEKPPARCVFDKYSELGRLRARTTFPTLFAFFIFWWRAHTWRFNQFAFDWRPRIVNMNITMIGIFNDIFFGNGNHIRNGRCTRNGSCMSCIIHGADGKNHLSQGCFWNDVQLVQFCQLGKWCLRFLLCLGTDWWSLCRHCVRHRWRHRLLFHREIKSVWSLSWQKKRLSPFLSPLPSQSPKFVVPTKNAGAAVANEKIFVTIAHQNCHHCRRHLGTSISVTKTVTKLVTIVVTNVVTRILKCKTPRVRILKKYSAFWLAVISETFSLSALWLAKYFLNTSCYFKFLPY